MKRPPFDSTGVSGPLGMMITSTGYNEDISLEYTYSSYDELDYEPLDLLYECLYCASVFDRDAVLKEGHCPSCGAPLDKNRLK